MSLSKNVHLLVVLLIILIVPSAAQEYYFPPPSAILIHNDTLTIFPPDSMPGEPVELLGYNILVDSVFYDNVMIEEPLDTVDYLLDYASILPGNRLFCVCTVYNLWISERLCDSALIVYGYELPFTEDWSSGNFDDNHWIVDSPNWTVADDEGNPGPAAVFSGLPAQTNYEIPLESYAFRGDQMNLGRYYLSFDLKLESNNNTGNEKFVIQEWNGKTDYWFDRIIYTNQQGSYSWTHLDVQLSSKPGYEFKVRFVARGINSQDILSWSVDNILFDRRCDQATNLTISEYEDYNELIWDSPYWYNEWWIYWCDGVFSGTSIGTGEEAEFDVAARWTAAQIDDYDEAPIYEIAFVPAESAATYNIRIWKGINAEELVYDQQVSNPVIGEWNYFELDTLIFIDATQDLWIGYHIYTPTGYPAGVDDGPARNGNGNMMFWQDAWQTLLDINPDLDYNWNIAALLGPGPPYYLYNIYRSTNDSQFELYDQTTSIHFDDTNIFLPDIYCYEVTILYNYIGDTCESLPTNIACEEEMISITETNGDTSVKVFPNPTGDMLNIEAVPSAGRIKIYNLTGHPVYEEKTDEENISIDVSGLAAGAYILEAGTGNNIFRKKILKR